MLRTRRVLRQAAVSLPHVGDVPARLDDFLVSSAAPTKWTQRDRGVLRQGVTVGRGYRRADFQSAWSRYLPPATQPPIRNTATNGPSEHEASVLRESIRNDVAAVTLPTGWSGPDAEQATDDDGEVAW